MHTNSTYPCPVEELNLRYITWLKQKYPAKQIGYSGHEHSLSTTIVTVALGATWIERHITLDPNQWGSDHKSSIEPAGLFSLITDIKSAEKAIQYEPQPRLQFEGENSKKASLRRKL
jgi:N-acetylneuraminate synthase